MDWVLIATGILWAALALVLGHMVSKLWRSKEESFIGMIITSAWLLTCPKCGAYLICHANGCCYCTRCGEEYRLEIKVIGGDYHADAA